MNVKTHNSFANPVGPTIAKLQAFLKTGRHRLVFMTERGEAYQRYLMRAIEIEVRAMDAQVLARQRRLQRSGKLQEAETLRIEFTPNKTLSEFLNQDLRRIAASEDDLVAQITNRIAALPETRYLVHRFEEIDQIIAARAPRFSETIPESFTWSRFSNSQPSAAAEIQRMIEAKFLNPGKIDELVGILDEISAKSGGLGNTFLGGYGLRRLNPRVHQLAHLQENYYRKMFDYMIQKDGKPFAEVFTNPNVPKPLKKLLHRQITQNFGRSEVSSNTRANMREALKDDPYLPKDLRDQINNKMPIAEGESKIVRSRGDKKNPITEEFEPVTNADWVLSDEAMMSTWNIVYRGHNAGKKLAKKPIGKQAASLYNYAASKLPGVKTLGQVGERASSFLLTGGASFLVKFPSFMPRWSYKTPLLTLFDFGRQYRSAMFAEPKLSWRTTEFHYEWVLEQISGLMMLTIANLQNTEVVPITERWGQVAVDVVCLFLVDSALVFFLSPRYQYWHPKQYLVTKPIRFSNQLIDRTVGSVNRGLKSYKDSLPDSPLQGMTVAEVATLEHLIPKQKLLRWALRRKPPTGLADEAASAAKRATDETLTQVTRSNNKLWDFYNNHWTTGGFRLDQRLSSYAMKAGLFAGVGFTSGVAANWATQFVFNQAYDLMSLFDTDAAIDSDKEFPDNLKVGKAWANLMAGVTQGSPLPWAETKDGAAGQLGDLPFVMTSTSRYALAGLVNNRIQSFFRTATGKGIRANPKVKSFGFTTLLMPVVKTLSKSKALRNLGKASAPVLETGMRYGVRFGNNYWGNKIWIMHAANSGIIPKKGNPGVLKSVVEYDLHSTDMMIDLKESEDSIIEAWEKSRGK